MIGGIRAEPDQCWQWGACVHSTNDMLEQCAIQEYVSAEMIEGHAAIVHQLVVATIPLCTFVW